MPKSTRYRLLSKCRREDRGYETECIIYLGEKDKDGYGRIKHKGKYVPAHWVLDGRPPIGKEKDHLCHQRDCVNPSHLEDVDRSENTKRREGVGTKKRMHDEDRRLAKSMLDNGWKVDAVADYFGVSRRTIGRLRND